MLPASSANKSWKSPSSSPPAGGAGGPADAMPSPVAPAPPPLMAGDAGGDSLSSFIRDCYSRAEQVKPCETHYGEGGNDVHAGDERERGREEGLAAGCEDLQWVGFSIVDSEGVTPNLAHGGGGGV